MKNRRGSSPPRADDQADDRRHAHDRPPTKQKQDLTQPPTESDRHTSREPDDEGRWQDDGGESGS